MIRVRVQAAIMTITLVSRLAESSLCTFFPSYKTLTTRYVHLHGRVSLQTHYQSNKTRNNDSNNSRGGTGRTNYDKISPSNSSTHSFGERPLDPAILTSNEYLDECVDKLVDWFHQKKKVLCITGAGISTDSGIPDYRGYNGSYHKGHKPMVHDQFISSESMRQRYWGRSMVGWKEFSLALPNNAHYSLAKLEKMGIIGVEFEDKVTYHHFNNETGDSMMRWAFTNGSQKMSIITQNVDGLHRKAGTQFLTELHGRNDRLKCMNCGCYFCRHKFHNDLEKLNAEWLNDINLFNERNSKDTKKDELRPDGDAYIGREVYDDIRIPSCQECENGFYKPDVVFFGDSVPRHRVERCYAAVDECDGLLCVGSSLAVHSAYRFVQHAAKRGTPIAILNVGETRAEVNGLDVLKVEAPTSQTLTALVDRLIIK